MQLRINIQLGTKLRSSKKRNLLSGHQISSVSFSDNRKKEKEKRNTAKPEKHQILDQHP
jgi:hypothetical protein